MELAHDVKAEPARLSPRARREADGHVLREGLAAHAADLRGRASTRSAATPSLSTRPSRRSASASPSPTWRATWSAGSTSSCSAPTRTTPSPRWPRTPRVPVINALSRLRASLPGARRLHDPRRALRLRDGAQASPTSATATTSATRSCSPARNSARTAPSATPQGFAPKLEIVAQGPRDRRAEPEAALTLITRSVKRRHRSRRRLHRRLHQHGLRARSHQARAHLQALSR